MRSRRSEEHTSELQSLYTISYAVFCLKKKKKLDGTTPKKRPRNDNTRKRRARLRDQLRQRHRFDDRHRHQNHHFHFFFSDTATREIYTVYNTLSLHDALPISTVTSLICVCWRSGDAATAARSSGLTASRSEEHTSELQSLYTISYAVFCL